MKIEGQSDMVLLVFIIVICGIGIWSIQQISIQYIENQKFAMNVKEYISIKFAITHCSLQKAIC